MLKVFKYQLTVTDTQRLDIPGLREVLHVGAIANTPYLWCLVDIEADYDGYTIDIVCTGHPANRIANATYVGTFTLFNGTFVGHVFIK